MAGSFQTAGELDGMRGGPTAGELRTDGAADRGRGAGRSPRGGRLAGLPEGVAVEADRIEVRFAGAEDDRPVRWLFGSRREPAKAQAAAGLLVVGLQQRLLSSVEAFARSLAVHRRTVERHWEHGQAETATGEKPAPASGTGQPSGSEAVGTSNDEAHEPLAKTGDRPGFICRKPQARDGQWAGRSV